MVVAPLSPAELTPSKPNPDEVSASKGKWVLTKEAFQKLLDHFSPDPEEAARKYEVMRSKLIRYFEWQSSLSPEDQADTAMNRVMRKIDEGANIFNLNGYFHEVAHNVYRESRRDPECYAQPIEDIPEIPAAPPVDDDQKEARLRCLDNCLDHQSVDNRKLILDYYCNEKRAKIDNRRQLAEKSTVNALRIRACRIRKGLEKCVRDCIKQTLIRNESGF